MNKSRFILLGAGCVALAVCLWQYEQYREIEAKHKRMQAVCNSLRSTERAMEKHRSEVMEMSRNVQSLRAGNKSKEEEIKRMQGRIQSLDIEVREKSDDLSKKRSLFERNRDLKQIIQRVENESVSYGDRVYKDHLSALLRMIVEGGDVNITWLGSGGMTALHYASLLELSYVRNWLIEHGANVLARTDDGLTPQEGFLREKRRMEPQWKIKEDYERNISSTSWESGIPHPGSESMSKPSQEGNAAIRKGGSTFSTNFSSPSMGETHADLQPMIDRMCALKC